MLLDPCPGFDLDLDVEMEHGSKDQPSGGGVKQTAWTKMQGGYGCIFVLNVP